jgi:hypothetical protein
LDGFIFGDVGMCGTVTDDSEWPWGSATDGFGGVGLRTDLCWFVRFGSG